MIEIVALFDRPQFIPLVAGWNWTEWRDLLPCDSCEAFAADLRLRTRRDEIPVTFLAIEDGVPIATASVIADDLETRPELTPWLASLYVVREHRGRGLGKRMVDHATEAARHFGVETLYLYTQGKVEFYERLGWQVFEATEFREHAITIMRKRLAAPTR